MFIFPQVILRRNAVFLTPSQLNLNYKKMHNKKEVTPQCQLSSGLWPEVGLSFYHFHICKFQAGTCDDALFVL